MAERLGLMQGDVIIAINRTTISNQEQLITSIIEALKHASVKYYAQ